MKPTAALAASILALALNTAAAEDSLGPHWIARLGVHPVNPQPDSHTEFGLDNASGLSIDTTYLFSEHWALEAFAAFPAAFDVHDAAGDRAARFEMIPLSATLQYHITDASGTFRAYAGLGIAHTMFGNEKTKGSLAGQSLKLDDSTGLSAVAGLDMYLGSKWFATADARWMDIDSSMSVGRRAPQTLQVDPYLFGLSVGRRFR